MREGRKTESGAEADQVRGTEDRAAAGGGQVGFTGDQIPDGVGGDPDQQRQRATRAAIRAADTGPTAGLITVAA